MKNSRSRGATLTELKGMLVYRLATRDPEPGPHRQRSYGNFIQLGGYSRAKEPAPELAALPDSCSSPPYSQRPIRSPQILVRLLTHKMMPPRLGRGPSRPLSSAATIVSPTPTISQLGVFKGSEVPGEDILALCSQWFLIGLPDGDEFSESDIDAEDYFNLLLSPA
ncbi:hypothetical protein HRG_013000 [Hirsutella rhossiliensis]